MKSIVLSDPHFSNDPIDEYRWGLFPWLEQQVADNGIEYVIMLGDYSIIKDKHPSAHVNRFVENIVKLSNLVDQVIMITGNHDYIESSRPFFGFLSKYPKIKFYTSPQRCTFADGISCWFLPNTKNPNEDWKGLDFQSVDFIFTHMTFQGAKVENGMPMEGISTKIFGKTDAKIISGDIHVPQNLGRITYVGSPYHCHFNDEFEPRLLMIDEDKSLKDLNFPCLKRHTITISNEQDIGQLSFLPAKDQCKIKMPTNVTDIKALQLQIDAAAKSLGLQICKIESVTDAKPKMEQIRQTVSSTDPFDMLSEYVKADHVDTELEEMGKDILTQAIKESNTICGKI